MGQEKTRAQRKRYSRIGVNSYEANVIRDPYSFVLLYLYLYIPLKVEKTEIKIAKREKSLSIEED